MALESATTWVLALEVLERLSLHNTGSREYSQEGHVGRGDRNRYMPWVIQVNKKVRNDPRYLSESADPLLSQVLVNA